MADEESESDAGSKDNSGQAAAATATASASISFGDKETPSAFTSVPVSVSASAEAEREIWNSSASSSSGPRSLILKRSSVENGFGFTLRHFIVYPPETNAILAKDRRLGLGTHVTGNEPMDTIFVKNVRENSPASAAGLTTGDRVLSVNDEDIAGLSYAKIIQLIHRTGNVLRLLVVPKENDLLQLYFSDTAHNPETNPRLRLHSPESSISSNSSVYAKPCSMTSSVNRIMYPYTKSETTSLVPSSTMSTSMDRERERFTSPGRAVSVRRSSEGNNERKSVEPPMSMGTRRMRDIYATPLTISDTSSCGSGACGPFHGMGGTGETCRFSLDAGVGRLNNYDSLSDSYGSEDSLIMNRLRKSFEQKEEFLNRPVSMASAANQKEFYGRPEKLAVSAWPPVLPAASASIANPRSPELSPIDSAAAAKARSKQNYFSTLDKIQENTQAISRSASETLANQPFQVVSVRTKQFEKGAPVQDKTDLYRSELARLSTRQNVANVAERKRDFENRAQLERQSFATRETRSLESAYIPPIYSTPGSGNRTIPIGSRHLHCEPPADFTMSNADLKSDDLLAQKNKPVVRQDSYLAACNKPTITITRKTDSGENLATVGENEATNNISGFDDDKSTRRISYIKATASGDCMHVDSEYELSDTEVAATLPPQRRSTRRWRTPLFPGDIQRLRRFFEDLAASGGERGILGSRKTTESFPDQDQHSIIKEGAVLCKVTQVEGKKAGDRSWKPIWLTLRGPFLYLCKEKKESLAVHGETPATFDRSDLGASCDRIDIRCSVVEVACDYTKRKHVFRVNAPLVGAELLLQADDAASMTQWVKVLQEQTLTPSNSNDQLPTSGSNVSPSSGNKTFKKFTSFRNRSPTAPCGDSPSNKAKKLVQNVTEAQQISPKSRTWKNKMAKQLRRIQPGSSSPNTQAVSTYPPEATIGIPLEICPSSSFSENVPLLVEICTSIVEAKGLEIIGIYRVPGNNAAVSSLTDAVNRGLDYTTLEQDPRWTDVNVISSLLKSFFRKLPDALLTSELYPHFIQADRIEDPVMRMVTLRKLVHDLPEPNFETLRHLLFHLKKIVSNSAVNKMEARNLAIVFGPTLVRNGDDMVTMVTDMSHQCRIVESLICHVDWCFGDGNLAELKASIPDINSVPELDATSSNHGVLLENIRKVEASMQSPVTAKDIVSTIIGAANRKKQKTSSKHSSNSRKSHSLSATITHNGSSSEDILSDNQNLPNSSKTKNGEKKDEEKKPELESTSTETSNSVTRVKTTSDVVDSKIYHINTGNNWTYANLAASTQERIRRFEQETKAMLQRELTRQKRSSDCAYEDFSKERASIRGKDESNGKQAEQLTSSLLLDKTAEIKKNNELAAIVQSDNSICDNPPPVIVMRRNLPNMNGRNVTINKDSNSNSDSNSNNLKRLKTSEEFVQDVAMNRSGSLDSLNRVARPASHVSDDGGDLLMSLTSTFDRKLKSLNEEMVVNSETDGNTVVRKRNSFNGRLMEDSSLYRDPSLHRSHEKSSKKIEHQNDDLELDKENNEKQKNEGEDIKEKRSCVTCGCLLKHSETAQQNCDNPKRLVLQETRPENRLQENVRREPKLFYSNSVKLRRSESLKEGNGVGTKLRRSGSLNKHEPKISKFESWMLTKNAEASKLKRSDSLTKSEKTESNMAKRRQMEMNKKARSEKESKMKRRSGSKNSIKRRHTVGGTKDFDKVTWLQNQQRDNNKENRTERRTSSPDLSSTRMTDFFIEVVVRPRSIISVDRNFISRLLNIPLESQV